MEAKNTQSCGSGSEMGTRTRNRPGIDPGPGPVNPANTAPVSARLSLCDPAVASGQECPLAMTSWEVGCWAEA
jgi:hypothetical protein